MSEHIYLRSLELSDCQRIHTWHNSPDLYETLIGTFHPVSMATVENWLKQRSSFSHKELSWAICLKENSEHIGNIYLQEIDYINRNGYLGMFLAKTECRGKGIAREALMEVMEYAFQTLGLERLYLYTFEDNLQAKGLTERCGFKMEGTFRRHIFKNGQFKNVVIMGMCRDEYLSLNKEKKS